MYLWINTELPKAGGDASEGLIYEMWCSGFLERVPESLQEEIGEALYQIYSAAKGIIFKIEWDTVNIDLSFFICLKFINIKYII